MLVRDRTMHFRHRGFTLIEMMVVIALAAIVLGMGVPSFKDFIVGQRVKSAAYAFSTAAMSARSEAIKRNTSVVLTQATGGWQNGWSVTVGTAVLARQDGFSSVTIASTSSTPTAVTYLGNGRLSAAVNALQFSGGSANHTRCISFDLSGMPKSRLGGC
jgi:type IV fimbrial biogenesis protein FimT